MNPSDLKKGKKYLFENSQDSFEVTYIYETLNCRVFQRDKFPCMHLPESSVFMFIKEIKV